MYLHLHRLTVLLFLAAHLCKDLPHQASQRQRQILHTLLDEVLLQQGALRLLVKVGSAHVGVLDATLEEVLRQHKTHPHPGETWSN